MYHTYPKKRRLLHPLLLPIAVLHIFILAWPLLASMSTASKRLYFRLDSLSIRSLLLPHLSHVLKLGLQVPHRLIHQELLQRPLFNISGLVLLEVVNVLYCARQDCAFGFFTRAVGNDATELINAFVDITPAAALDFFLC